MDRGHRRTRFPVAFSSQNFLLFCVFFRPFSLGGARLGMHGWKDFSPLRKSVSVEVLSQGVQDVAPKWRLRAGWGVNELIKKHALDSDAPNWSSTVLLSGNIKCHTLVCLEDQIGHFVFARETGARRCRIALWDCLWTNLDPVSLPTS